VWLFTLQILHRYKKAEERSSLNDAMAHLLPLIQQICTQLLADQSELSVTIQKQILKIFFTLIQVIVVIITLALVLHTGVTY